MQFPIRARSATLTLAYLLGAAAVCIGFGVLTVHVGYAVIAVVLGSFLLVVPLTPTSITLFIIILVILPDSPTLLQIRNFQITPRLVAFIALAFHVALGVAQRRVSPRFTFARLWLLYAAVVIAGGLVAHRLQAIPLFVLFALFPYAVGCTVGSDRAILRAVIRGLMVGALILSAVALVEYVRNRPFVAPVFNNGVPYFRAGGLRANAGWIHPLALGMFLSLVAFFVIDEGRRRGPLVAVLVTLLIGGGVFATGERSPLLGLAAGFFVYVLAQVNTRNRRNALVLACIVLVAVLAVPGSRAATFRQFFGTSTANGSASSANVVAREQLLSLGIHAVSTRPLLGFGYGTVANVRGNSSLVSLLSGKIVYTDVADWPIAIAIETGLLGLTLFASVIFANLQRLVRFRQRNYPLPVVAAFAGLIAALVTSLAVVQDVTSLVFLFALGLASTGSALGHRPRTDTRPPP